PIHIHRHIDMVVAFRTAFSVVSAEHERKRVRPAARPIRLPRLCAVKAHIWQPDAEIVMMREEVAVSQNGVSMAESNQAAGKTQQISVLLQQRPVEPVEFV